jgi:regulator of protease activity HflC (stomatin/prohibitin superfamily)
MSDTAMFLLFVLAGASVVPLGWLLLKALHIEVEDGFAALVTRWGRLQQTIREPGWHWVFDRFLPWVQVRQVSLNTAYRNFKEIVVHDLRGTTVVVDIWLEVRIQDPAKALFQVTDWDAALRNLVSHAVISILGNRQFEQILCDRTELGELLRKDVAQETERWGLAVDSVYIRNVSLRPEVAQGLFQTVAAKLERAKADVEEDGRQRVALLEAETSARVARLVAEAKGHYPAAVGRAYARLEKSPVVLAAYEELYSLSLVRPHRTIAFQGFEDGSGLRAMDAAMVSSFGDGESGMSMLGGEGERMRSPTS